MKTPTVSVIMITYGQEMYIKQAIEGVLMQKTNFAIELIIGDDHPANDTEIIVEDIIQTHSKGHLIKYTRHKTNKGIVKNFIWTMQQGKGKYLALCEGDDYWTDTLKLQKQFDYMENDEKLVFSFHGSKRLIENEKRFETYPYNNILRDGIIPLEILFRYSGGIYPTASAMFRKEILDNLPQYFKSFGVGDTPLLLLAISKGNIGYIAEEMCVYRTHSANWSADNELFSNKLKAYYKKCNAYKEFDVFTKLKYSHFLTNTISRLTYQVLFAHNIISKNRRQNLSFIRECWNRLLFADKLKIILRFLNK